MFAIYGSSDLSSCLAWNWKLVLGHHKTRGQERNTRCTSGESSDQEITSYFTLPTSTLFDCLDCPKLSLYKHSTSIRHITSMREAITCKKNVLLSHI